MTRMNTALISKTTIIFCLINGFSVDSALMNGENVCPVEEETEELSFHKHEQTVVLQTTRACLDVSQLFRCKVRNNGTKLTYRALPTKKKKIVYKCCPGYYETREETCAACLAGYYGSNCSLRCNCSENEKCDNVVGCCDPSTDSCGIMRNAAMKAHVESDNWLLPALLASLLAIVVLSFGTIFYRSKYKKEKDPDLPTLTYYPHVKELLTDNRIETREFNNPMYRRSAMEAVPIKIVPGEPVPIGNNEQQRSPLVADEYATVDYAVPPGHYEIPLQSPISKNI